MSQPEPTGSDTGTVGVTTDATAGGTVTPGSAAAPLPTGPATGGSGGASPDSGTGPHS